MSDGGSWSSDYGHFFLSWYSNQLMQHADRVLGAAAAALNKRGRPRQAMAVKEVCCMTMQGLCREGCMQCATQLHSDQHDLQTVGVLSKACIYSKERGLTCVCAVCSMRMGM